MAAIEKVELHQVPEKITVDSNTTTKISVTTQIIFHPLDQKLKMEYILYLFIYDIHDTTDSPMLLPNWKASEVQLFQKNHDRKDDFLCKECVEITADSEDRITLETPMDFKIGMVKENMAAYTREFKVLAQLIPAVFNASKWSEAATSKLLF